MSPANTKRLGVIVAISVAVLVPLLSRNGGDEPVTTVGTATAESTVITTPSLTPTTESASSSNASTTAAAAGGEAPWEVCVDGDPDTITPDELPDEAIEVIELIEDGGPFPYSQDGSTFQNREGILPDHERGYYAEYTVETPGSDDRGARRIVGGDCGELWYTDDHYDSFELIEIDS